MSGLPGRPIRSAGEATVIGAPPISVGDSVTVAVPKNAESVTVIAPDGREQTVVLTGDFLNVPLNQVGTWRYIWSTGEAGTWEAAQPAPKPLELIDETAAAQTTFPTPTLPLYTQRPQ